MKTAAPIPDLRLSNNTGCHSKTAIEIFHIECNTTPVRYLIKQRRLMYLWHVLSRDDNELIKRVYLAQRHSRSRLDWINQVVKDKNELGIELTDQQISSMSKDRFRHLLKRKIHETSNQFLGNLKSGHSKSTM